MRSLAKYSLLWWPRERVNLVRGWPKDRPCRWWCCLLWFVVFFCFRFVYVYFP
jgi:hypothetical protein